VIVAAHQPNFAPWLGFLDKMRHADVLVLLDTVQFIKRGYQNRTKLKGPDGPQWLTIPVITKGRYDQQTRAVEIDETAKWRDAHLRTIRSILGKAPHISAVLDAVEPIYTGEHTSSLVEFNMAILRAMVKGFGISTRLVMASDLGCETSSTRLMLDVTKAVGGTVYLSGPTGRNYLEPEMFPPEGVELRYHEFSSFSYPQRFGDFEPGLSCIDYAANVGFLPFGHDSPDESLLTKRCD
jgi:WbqC-like protein